MISSRTAQLGLVGLRVAIRAAAAERNGSPLTADIRTALIELAQEAATGLPTSTLVDAGPGPVQACEQIGTAEAARRLGISRQAVHKRCVEGTLPAKRVGRAWAIEWRET